MRPLNHLGDEVSKLQDLVLLGAFMTPAGREIGSPAISCHVPRTDNTGGGTSEGGALPDVLLTNGGAGRECDFIGF